MHQLRTADILDQELGWELEEVPISLSQLRPSPVLEIIVLVDGKYLLLQHYLISSEQGAGAGGGRGSSVALTRIRNISVHSSAMRSTGYVSSAWDRSDGMPVAMRTLSAASGLFSSRRSNGPETRGRNTSDKRRFCKICSLDTLPHGGLVARGSWEVRAWPETSFQYFFTNAIFNRSSASATPERPPNGSA